VEKPHILIVEDEPQLLLLMRLELEGVGFTTSLAADGNEALEAMRSAMPDLVLLDLMMPFLDGWGVLEELRQWTHKPPVIVTSAIGLHSQRQRADGMGAQGYLVKPFPIEELLDLIRSILGPSAAGVGELPSVDSVDVWGDATRGYHARMADGPRAGVWQVRFQEGSWNLAAQRFDAPPCWIARSPSNEDRVFSADPPEGVPALEAWLTELMSADAAAAIIMYCAPSQDRLGRIIPRRHLVV
jgi:CheY-like chemotaxis protein